ncbi:PhnA domain-containing protein [Winogradskyella sp. 3972H.M.0a.05]|uniref:PhnA domain-containing protein n=1 Tax=Winogradskyella sp. 3972H.M.0a.05 TaxID=2950277 RepID=UPI0033978EA5
MSLERDLQKRSHNCCELCKQTENLRVFTVPPASQSLQDSLYVCDTCEDQMTNSDNIDPNHWRCLNDSMWSEHRAVQVMAWRMLNRLKAEGWPQDLLDMMYLDEETLAFANAEGDGDDGEDKLVHRDVNGAVLQAGDSVVLIKDLKVKGSSMVAKQGTAVRRISLDHDNAEYIEGKVDGQHIVIVTKYVKRL